MNEQRRFLNQMQPQTMVIATILLYINAFFNVISFVPLLLLIGLAMGVGGFGIANEQRWGYSLALVGAGANLALLLLVYRGAVLEFPIVISLLFDGALLLLLLHPETRNYQRIYFR